MIRRVSPREIVVSADRLEDCKEYIGREFHEMIDHALSVGWSLDEVVVAVGGLAAEEVAIPDRAITLH